MKSQKVREVPGYVSLDLNGPVGMLTLKGNIVRGLMNIDVKTGLLEAVRRAKQSETIHALLISDETDSDAPEFYEQFIKDLYAQKASMSDMERLCNAVNQTIMAIAGLPFMVVHANKGRVIPLLMNIGLACDYRVISESTLFLNPAAELGLAPKGGGAYFLSRTLGMDRTAEILLRTEPIDAAMALSLGMVSAVVPEADLMPCAMKKARDFAEKPPGATMAVKQILNYCMHDLQGCLEYENEVIRRMIRSGRNTH